jgi:hypothetical protein
MMDNFTKEIVFVIEVSRGEKVWKLEKSLKVVNMLFRRFSESELEDLQTPEGCEASRIKIAELLEVTYIFI